MKNLSQKSVIIVAGGTGKRMGGDIPKQFIEISGKPVLMHTMLRFFDFDSNISVSYTHLTLPTIYSV